MTVEAPPPDRQGSHGPYRWKWVDPNRVSNRGRFYDLIQRGWIETDGNGRVRPTGSFPIDVAAAFGELEL